MMPRYTKIDIPSKLCTVLSNANNERHHAFRSELNTATPLFVLFIEPALVHYLMIAALVTFAEIAFVKQPDSVLYLVEYQTNPKAGPVDTWDASVVGLAPEYCTKRAHRNRSRWPAVGSAVSRNRNLCMSILE